MTKFLRISHTWLNFCSNLLWKRYKWEFVFRGLFMGNLHCSSSKWSVCGLNINLLNKVVLSGFVFLCETNKNKMQRPQVSLKRTIILHRTRAGHKVERPQTTNLIVAEGFLSKVCEKIFYFLNTDEEFWTLYEYIIHHSVLKQKDSFSKSMAWLKA